MFRQFNAVLYIEMMISFTIPFSSEIMNNLFQTSFISLQKQKNLSFCLEILNLLILTEEGMNLFINHVEFLEELKNFVHKSSNQIEKIKIIQFFELSICSQKINLINKTIKDHFAFESFNQFSYFIFYEENVTKLNKGIK